MPSLRARQILAEIAPGPIEGALERLCAACVLAVPTGGAALALMTTEGHGGTLVATNERAAAMEALQQSLGEGPGISAAHDGRPVLESDLAARGARWPIFTSAATEAGIAAVFAFPLQMGAIRLGVLDLHDQHVRALDAHQIAEASAFAEAARTIVLNLQDDRSAEELHPALGDTIDGDRRIHQATGMVAIQASVGLAEALLLLQARAFTGGRSLLDLAEHVVARRIRFTKDGDE